MIRYIVMTLYAIHCVQCYYCHYPWTTCLYYLALLLQVLKCLLHLWLLSDELSHPLKNCQPSWIYTTPTQYKSVVEGLAKANVSVKVCFYTFAVHQQDNKTDWFCLWLKHVENLNYTVAYDWDCETVENRNWSKLRQIHCFRRVLLYTTLTNLINWWLVMISQTVLCSISPFSSKGAWFTKYLTTILRLKVKVKFSHTRYRVLGPELIPVYRQSARRWREVNHAIYPAVICHCFLPGLRLPS